VNQGATIVSFTAQRRKPLPSIAARVIAGVLAAGGLLHVHPPATAERTAALPPLALPADEAPHGSPMEWWYYSGILRSADGERFAFHQVVFVVNGLIKHTVMHAALTDLRSGQRYLSQRRTGGAPAQAVHHGYDFHQADWQVRADGATHALRVQAQDARVDLQAVAEGPLLTHRATDSATPGRLDFGRSGVSHYYSRPRMPAQGEIRIGGKKVAVRGELWFDHQWGNFDVLALGWNWLSLRLADGANVMLYQLFDTDTGHAVLTAGTLADDRGTRPLHASEIALLPEAHWTSPRTAIPYVVGWRIRLPTGELQVRPLQADSEFDASGSSGNVYWEGAVQALDAQGDVAGEGFLELSGYDRKAAAATRRVAVNQTPAAAAPD